uniref:Uncharacterized protein n=1 Tax=Anopheles coluzzii TaxID=1518534 RepID=A0A8W7PZH5_ANOCL
MWGVYKCGGNAAPWREDFQCRKKCFLLRRLTVVAVATLRRRTLRTGRRHLRVGRALRILRIAGLGGRILALGDGQRRVRLLMRFQLRLLRDNLLLQAGQLATIVGQLLRLLGALYGQLFRLPFRCQMFLELRFGLLACFKCLGQPLCLRLHPREFLRVCLTLLLPSLFQLFFTSTTVAASVSASLHRLSLPGVTFLNDLSKNSNELSSGSIGCPLVKWFSLMKRRKSFTASASVAYCFFIARYRSISVLAVSFALLSSSSSASMERFFDSSCFCSCSVARPSGSCTLWSSCSICLSWLVFSARAVTSSSDRFFTFHSSATLLGVTGDGFFISRLPFGVLVIICTALWQRVALDPASARHAGADRAAFPNARSRNARSMRISLLPSDTNEWRNAFMLYWNGSSNSLPMF